MATADMPPPSATETLPSAPLETIQMKLHSRQGRFSPAPPTEPRPKQKLKIDPLRALEPARKKLGTLEAQRVMAVLVDAIKRTEIVTALPFIVENLDRFSISFGKELVRKLQDHKMIIDSFDEIKAEAGRLFERQKRKEEEEKWEDDNSASDLSSHSSDMRANAQLESAMKQLQVLARTMQASCKDILRVFALNPSAMSLVLKECRERSPNADAYIAYLNELKDILMHKLLTTPVEEAERNDFIHEIMEREKYNSSVIARLDVDLKAAVADKENEIMKKNDVIRKLQSDLHNIEKFSDDTIRRTKSESDKQQAADQKNSEGKCVRLQQELQGLESSLANNIAEHRESEADLRKRKFKFETEVDNWIQKYDVDMGTRQDQYEEIDAVYTEEKKQLNELEERFKTLEVEYDQIMEERRVARERREAAERDLMLAIKAATTVQAFWRSFKVRAALKKKKKGKKGKKGKK